MGGQGKFDQNIYFVCSANATYIELGCVVFDDIVRDVCVLGEAK